MRQFARFVPAGECLDQRRQVLSRLDGPDRKDEPITQAVLIADASQDNRVRDRPERRCRRFVDHVDPLGRQLVDSRDVVFRAFRHGDDRVGTPRGEIDERTVEQHASRRVISRIEREAHVVNRHDRRHARHHRHHAVGKVHDIGPEPFQQPGREHLHPDHARHTPGRGRDLHTRGQRARRIDDLIGDHDDFVDFVLRALAHEMTQEVLAVVADSRAARPKRGAVKRDAHRPRSASRQQRQGPGRPQWECTCL